MDRRLTTILAADLVGYSRLMAADEEGVIARLRLVRAEVVDPALAEAGGRIVKTMGDGLLVEFTSPVAAVRAALVVQRAMAARETGPGDQQLKFRVGVNLGDIVIDGDDILGDGVNVAARLETLAPPGGLCISRAVHDQVRGKLDAVLTPLGPQPMKNLPEPVEVWRVEVEGAEARPAVSAGTRPSIAVLPFDNMSRDADQDFLADGIVEDVITELSRFRDLTVIARNSSFSFRGQATDVRRIAEALGVRYVVEGSVRRAGGRLRLTAQLIDAADGSHVWAGRWDRTMADLFDLQDELTQAIVTAVAPEISAHERTLARRKPTESLTAWELAQRAHAEYYRYTAETVQATIALATRAIEADPELVLAHTLLARARVSEAMAGWSADPEGSLRAARAAAERAVEIDSRNDAAFSALGFALAFSGRFREAIEMLERAKALNPNNPITLLHLAVTRFNPSVRDAARALDEGREALRLSPTDPFAWTFHLVTGLALLLMSDLDAALESLDTARGYPNVDWKPALVAALAAVVGGQPERARERVTEALALRPELTLALARHGMREAFAQPPFAAVAEQLVDLGLPRGSPDRPL
jgi:adenylate cyclase